uniref:Peptidase M12B domain-containing protein n=1 Tax=Hippocampus comes TaxID=109280 RepID=A0A3Q2YWG8_HIPCM
MRRSVFTNVALRIPPVRRRTDKTETAKARHVGLRCGTCKVFELVSGADNRDYEKIKTRIMEIANYVDKFYRALNIRVPLIGLEVWTERDQCIVTEEPNATLWSFLQWRQKLKSRKKHDNAQLLTGVIFKGTTIGMAPLEGMCSLENSGGINVDHSELSIGAAATMAHEIGHNFGMSHDHDGCSSVTPARSLARSQASVSEGVQPVQQARP